jgi:formate C-acetyltransferase
MEIMSMQVSNTRRGSGDGPDDAWRGFRGQVWRDSIDTRRFIQDNYTPYEGDAGFLTGPTERTTGIWAGLTAMFTVERERGVYDVDAHTPSSITAHAPGYIDRDAELIVGLQTDAPLKRAIMPSGGWRMVETGLRTYGYEVDPRVKEIFTRYRKTHNEGVFDAYTAEILAARRAHIITGLPDAYGRGRIIGDYRRVALYGVDRLITDKRRVKSSLDALWSDEHVIRDREELAEQIRALGELAEMARSYGLDISGPARTAQEAVQWLYFGYLAAVKEQNGAAMSLGRTSTFLDVYLQRDLDEGRIDESAAQELIDDFVIKLRIIRFLRTPEYDALFSGDPTWVTEAIGGMGDDGRTLVTKTSFRLLQTLNNLGPAPEPNLTVLWSPRLPQGFKDFAARMSVETSSVQYESDELLRPVTGDDTAIACCVSAMPVGKQMQFFGARVNLAKTLLYAINGGRDEMSGEQVAPPSGPHPVGADHHVQRGLRQGDRQHAGWPPVRRAVLAGSQPDERPRPARLGRLRVVGGQAALRPGAGWHLADQHPGAFRAWQDLARAGRQPDRPARRLL